MERLLSHHQHSVLSILPHILIHIEGRYWHVDPTRQKLHLNQDELRHQHHVVYVIYIFQSTDFVECD